MLSRRFPTGRWAISMLMAGAIACSGTESAGDANSAGDAEAPGNALTCGTSRTLRGAGIGALTIGLSVDSLRIRCTVVADTTDPKGPEGMPERRVVVRIDSAEATAIVSNDTVQRIEVDSPALQTGGGLGVGTTVAQLRPHAPRVVAGEGNVAAVLEGECGMSFLLDVRQAGAMPTLDMLADSVRVRRVLLFGCPPDARRP